MKAKILVVDDDRLARLSLVKLLSKSGYDVVAAVSGEQALEFYPLHPFDLIITDIRMPGMNGIETLSAIRQARDYEKKSRLPEIVLTAYNDNAVVAQAERMGVHAFILKPYDLESLLETVERALRGGISGMHSSF